MKKSTPSPNDAGRNAQEIEIVSIILVTRDAPVAIPISGDAPLRCADMESLRGIGAQMESLIRVLVKASADCARPDGGPPGECFAIAVW